MWPITCLNSLTHIFDLYPPFYDCQLTIFEAMSVSPYIPFVILISVIQQAGLMSKMAEAKHQSCKIHLEFVELMSRSLTWLLLINHPAHAHYHVGARDVRGSGRIIRRHWWRQGLHSSGVEWLLYVVETGLSHTLLSDLRSKGHYNIEHNLHKDYVQAEIKYCRESFLIKQFSRSLWVCLQISTCKVYCLGTTADF